MIERQITAEITTIITHYGATISDIDNVHLLFDEERNNGAGTALVKHVVTTLCECFNSVEEIVLCLLISIDYGLTRILWELDILDNELMQVVSQEVSAGVAAVPIEDSEEAALGPVLDIFLGRRLHDVQDDADPVLVVVSDNALIRVRGVSHYESVFAHTALRRLPARQVESARVGRWSVAQQQLFYVKGLVVLDLARWPVVRGVAVALNH